MEKPAVYPGAAIGRWTVLDTYTKTPRGEKKWLCRCECGTERYVLERSLKHGGSYSCGCMRLEQLREAISYDLTGKVFGDLTVLHRADRQHKNGGIWWTCRCSCGSLHDTPGTLLMTGRKTHCGCKTQKNYYTVGISGQRFHRLTALYRVKDKGGTRGALWHCRCDCGNEVDVPYNNLVYCNQKSCGCQKKEREQNLGIFLTHVAGTSLDMLKSKKVPTDNTTGYKGVYRAGNRFFAKIVFQKKQYYLGYHDKLEDAAEARRKAEEVLFDEFADYYGQYQQIAARTPEWAEENPIGVKVEKVGDELLVKITPPLPIHTE